MTAQLSPGAPDRTMTSERLDLARRLAAQLRVDSIRCSAQAGSGHPTCSLSAADLMAVLLVGHLRYDWASPDQPTNDNLNFSTGYASLLLYSMYRAVGVVDEKGLVDSYRRFASRLEGHTTLLLALRLRKSGISASPEELARVANDLSQFDESTQ